MTWIVVIGLGTLAVLVAVQIYAAGRTNRVLNVGLLAASVIVAVLLLWTLLRFNAEQNSLVRAQCLSPSTRLSNFFAAKVHFATWH